METAEKIAITVEAVVKAPVEKVWKYWNEPEHIKRWAFASDDWHAPYSENDLRKDGTFKTTMAPSGVLISFSSFNWKTYSYHAEVESALPTDNAKNCFPDSPISGWALTMCKAIIKGIAETYFINSKITTHGSG